jgi:hypothetical protein
MSDKETTADLIAEAREMVVNMVDRRGPMVPEDDVADLIERLVAALATPPVPNTPEPLVLPTEPGTVIAIGEWWLVRLRPYQNEDGFTAPSAWELLPWPTPAIRKNAEDMGIAAQCVYGDAWVQAEAEQEGNFRIISTPVEETT